MAKLFCRPFLRFGLVGAVVAMVLYSRSSSDHLLPFGGPGAAAEDEWRGSSPGDPAVQIIVENVVAKDALTDELLAERLSFAEAVTRFRLMDARRPPHLPLRLPDEWGTTAEERYAHCVFCWAETQLKYQPDPEATRVWLEAKLREYLQSLEKDRPRQHAAGEL